MTASVKQKVYKTVVRAAVWFRVAVGKIEVLQVEVSETELLSLSLQVKGWTGLGRSTSEGQRRMAVLEKRSERPD